MTMSMFQTGRAEPAASKKLIAQIKKTITQINGGFTLIELLIVIVLFSAGAVTLLEIFSVGLSGGGENENTLISTALAQDKMELIRNTSYGSIGAEAKAPVTGYPFFQREVLVTTPQANLKQITVNVFWAERSGEMKISLVTYASNI